MIEAVGEYQYAIGIVLTKGTASRTLLFGGMDQQIIARLIGASLNSLQHRREKRAADLGHHQTNRMCPSACQHARRLARNELEFVHGKAYSISFFILHGSGTVQNAADRGYGDPSMAGNISNRGRTT